MKALKLEPSNAAKLLDAKALEEYADVVAAKASSAAAADVRREARRSIKRGGEPRTLERGGRGRVVSVKYSASYLARATRKKKRSRTADFSPPCRKHGTARVTRPKAERPYTVYGEDGRFATIRDYRYFYSREEWEAARDSPGFLSWAKTARRRVEERVPVAPRPYMAPALAKTSSPEVAEPRLKRIVKAAAREFVGGGKPKTKGRRK